MTHFYERNIVEIKNEYTTFLINIMTPFLYEGLKSIYTYALEADKEFKIKSRNDPSVKSPGILKIFQTCLREIPSLNNHSIEQETNRIKDKSRCSEWFDDLVKAVIKSNIVLLTFSTGKRQSELVNDKYHERIHTKDFVHKCLIESARMVYNNPELFWHEYPTLEIKRNQRETCELIKQAVNEAIRKMLPMKIILKEYLKNEYVKESFSEINRKMTDSQFMNVKAMVKRDLHGEHFRGKTDDSLLEDEYDGFRENAKENYGLEGIESMLEDDSQNRFEVVEKEVPELVKQQTVEESDKNKEDELFEMKEALKNIENELSENVSDKSLEERVDEFLGKEIFPQDKPTPRLEEIETDERDNISEKNRSAFFAKYV